MASALLMCRSPFQAMLAGHVLRQEGVDQYDLLYFTHSASAEDKRYFAQLSDKASLTELVHVAPQRANVATSALFHWRSRAWQRDWRHDLVILSSIDDLTFSSIVRRQTSSALVTFDDGMSNILSTAIYKTDRFQGRGEVYRQLFGAYRMADIRRRIARHYTIYPQFENIVEPARLRTVEGTGTLASASGEAGPAFFIGQPFREAMSETDLERLHRFLKGRRFDFYVRHPRERTTLDLGAPELDKAGRIAEEAILATSNGRKPTVVGWHSNVMFNLPQQLANKELLIFHGAANAAELERLAQATGCSVTVVP